MKRTDTVKISQAKESAAGTFDLKKIYNLRSVSTFCWPIVFDSWKWENETEREIWDGNSDGPLGCRRTFWLPWAWLADEFTTGSFSWHSLIAVVHRVALASKGLLEVYLLSWRWSGQWTEMLGSSLSFSMWVYSALFHALGHTLKDSLQSVLQRKLGTEGDG